VFVHRARKCTIRCGMSACAHACRPPGIRSCKWAASIQEHAAAASASALFARPNDPMLTHTRPASCCLHANCQQVKCPLPHHPHRQRAASTCSRTQRHPGALHACLPQQQRQQLPPPRHLACSSSQQQQVVRMMASSSLTSCQTSSPSCMTACPARRTGAASCTPVTPSTRCRSCAPRWVSEGGFVWLGYLALG